MLTPQAIKDQEFQIKFRGYDTIEVKAYLELLAEDFFTLAEGKGAVAEELEALRREKESLSLRLRENQDGADGVQQEVDTLCELKDQEIRKLTDQLQELKEQKATLARENTLSRELLDKLEKKIVAVQTGANKEQAEVERLTARVELLEGQNRELKQEGVDFKTTILAAQNFADNLRQTGERDAKQLMDEARAEVEAYRSESEAELARLPVEIMELKAKKAQVHDELMGVLQGYLDGLELFKEDGDTLTPIVDEQHR